ncbi:LOW QUALITY PROTEIN: hypothetical protein U9M48_008050 [Paspalum notatum var. saurae]|uniref:Reverse transcriptase n=1 Tax=Paspalum notatum var. saurae TaxID=547442 RepID=A0AAQ3SNR6_PASNO
MKLDEQLALIISKLDEQKIEIQETNRGIMEVRNSVEELKVAKGEFEIWKPQVENQVVDLQATVADLRQQVGHLLNKADLHKSAKKEASVSAHLETTSPEATLGQNSHGDEHQHRRDGQGVKEVLMGNSNVITRRIETPSYLKNTFRGNTAQISVKGQESWNSEERRTNTAERGKSQGDKVSALMAYRKAKGLCFKCGTKWGMQHKCPSSVSLNVVEELWQLVSDKSKNAELVGQAEDHDSGDDLMALSAQVVSGTTSNRTIKLYTYIHHHSALLLVDSGSSHSFISEQFATKLTPWKLLKEPIQVKVADGGIFLCTHELEYCPWLFHTTFKILPLKCYDTILGIEWLEQNSPVMVDWADKWFSFCHLGKEVRLQGVQENPVKCLLASGTQLYAVTASPDETESVPEMVQELIRKYKQLFVEPTGVSTSKAGRHTIPLLPGTQPFRLRPYRYTPLQKNEIEQQVTQLLQNKMIVESTNPFASPAPLVKNKSGEWRLCVDYRRLNAQTVKNKFPLPVTEELFEELVGASWFTTLDLRSGFHQIPMAEEDQYKTAFQTHFGHFEYKVMPYGLIGAPATFQATMNYILAALLRKCVVVFIDDILIYSKTFEKHLSHLQQVFEIFLHYQFKVRLSKCSFAQQKLKYLGHIISKEEVAIDPTKIIAVQNWLVPQSVKELRGFLGLVGYYRRFVKNFGLIAKPLTELLKKGVLFIWTSVTEQAFNSLKQALVEAPVLALPDFSKPFIVETDASERDIGAVLQQNGHPIAYISKALGVKNQGLSTYEKESLAILMAVDHWRAYLQPAEFVIFTDHRSLTNLDDQRLHTYWQQKTLTKLFGLRYKICYKKGTTNSAADALSRRAHPDSAEICAISVAQPFVLHKVIILCLKELLNTKDAFGFYTVTLCSNKCYQPCILDQLEGILVILLAQHEKENSKFVSKLKQKESLIQDCYNLWKFRTCLASNFNGLCGRFAKFFCLQLYYVCSLCQVESSFTALKVAKLFMEHIHRLHGMPEAIISDRDRIFTSLLWQELFKLSGTKLHMSTAYHPQSDGQTERVNQCVEGFLRCFCQACPTQWSQWLVSAEFWYNTSLDSALKKSPFEVLYGHSSRHFGITCNDACSVPNLENWLSERKIVTQLLKQQLNRVNQAMKLQADRHRTEQSFQVGDFVWLKLQPYIQSSLASRAHHKLSYRYFRPYQKVSAVAYKLQLPANSSVHPVFHVSLLKKAVGSFTVGNLPLPPDSSFSQVPEMILDQRLKNVGNRVVDQVLVKWAHLAPELATWEDVESLRKFFPSDTAWGQAVFQGRANVKIRVHEAEKEHKRRNRAEKSAGSFKEDAGSKKDVAVRPIRSRRPNPNCFGPDWKW